MLDPKTILTGFSLQELFERFPYIDSCFASIKIEDVDETLTCLDFLNGESEARFMEFGLSKKEFAKEFVALIQKLEQQEASTNPNITGLLLQGGTDKNGNPENVEFKVTPGQIVCLAGPTGAGKSRLLADIECLAEGDTITKRRVTLLGNGLSAHTYDLDNTALTAQLSQTMNFLLDMSVDSFLLLHAEARKKENPEEIVKTVLTAAINLSGEPFSPSSSLLDLSGGQSRALMIADTALISDAPIVLIDELENAGIDKLGAMDLLCQEEKMVFISTHDPVLALKSDVRLIISNGGIVKIIHRSQEDLRALNLFLKLDKMLSVARNDIRLGRPVKTPDCTDLLMEE